MADVRPSSAPLFESRELYLSDAPPSLRPVRGANQFLRGPAHDGQSTLGPRGNRVQAGQVPRTLTTVGPNTAAKPLGR